MVARPVTLALCALLSACLPPVPPAVVDEPAFALPPFRVHISEPRPPYFGDARPCLVDTQSCLELAPGPFAPCLTALERCSREGRVELLVGRHAGEPRR